jgi:hypothetical protein
MFCQQCGNEASTQVLFCPSCGSKNLAVANDGEESSASEAAVSGIEVINKDVHLPPPLPKVSKEEHPATAQNSQPPPLKQTEKPNLQSNATNKLTAPNLKKINHKLLLSFYLISVLGTLGAFVSGQLTAMFDDSGELFAQETAIFTIIYFLFYIATIVMFCISLYRAWEVLQSTTARTSSGLAVGLLFVPVFNVYWVFQALWGWSKDYQSFTSYQEKGTMPYVNKQIFLAHCILLPMLAIPIINNVIAYFIVPTTLIVIFQMSKATNYIIENNLVDTTDVNS